MSTSGSSKNVVAAMEMAKQKNCVTVALIGEQTTVLNELCHFSVNINSVETARVQEAHTFVNHLICEGLDDFYALN